MDDNQKRKLQLEQIRKIAGSLPTPPEFIGRDIEEIIQTSKHQYWEEKCKRDFKNLKLKID